MAAEMTKQKDPSQEARPVVYYCDPQKAEACKKGGCFVFGGPCHLTFSPAHAIILDGEPMRGPTVYGPLADGFEMDESWRRR